MTYFVYILKCSDNSYYTGVTKNYEKRVYEHQNGMIPGCYTHSRRPIELVLIEEFDDIRKAIEREKQIKGWSRNKKQALIERNFEALKKYSRNGILRQAQDDKDGSG